MVICVVAVNANKVVEEIGMGRWLVLVHTQSVPGVGISGSRRQVELRSSLSRWAVQPVHKGVPSASCGLGMGIYGRGMTVWRGESMGWNKWRYGWWWGGLLTVAPGVVRGGGEVASGSCCAVEVVAEVWGGCCRSCWVGWRLGVSLE